MFKKFFKSIFGMRTIIALLLILQILFFFYTIWSRSIISTALKYAMTFLSLAVSIYIISRRDKGAYKLTWVFLILLFPLFGGLFYLIFNFQITSRMFDKKITRTHEKNSPLYYLPGDAEIKAKERFPFLLPQIDYLQKFAGFPVYDDTAVHYLSPGEVKFERLLEELNRAEKYIFLEYFIIEEGKMWNTILEILKKKAREGVLVRVIYDEMGCFFLLPKNYPKTLRRYGIDCVVFNRFRPFLSTLQNNRNHRKIAVIDGKVAFTGGINLADEYINAIDKHGHWKDASVVLEGKAAWSFTLMFLQMWELCTGKTEDYKSYYPGEYRIPSDGFAQPYCDSPLDSENVCEHVYLQIINNAHKYVYINTPYLILDDSMLSALSLASKSGVDIRIVTPHRPDKWYVHTLTRSYYRDLIRAGVKIYEYERGFIHSKTFVSDDVCATVGTVNMDFRSLYLHFECGVRIYGGSSIDEIKHDFEETLKICKPISERDCKCRFITKIIREILRIFAPLM